MKRNFKKTTNSARARPVAVNLVAQDFTTSAPNAAHAFQDVLEHHGIVRSMSGKGHCYDNALEESFFHTPETELVDHEHYRTREHARASLFECSDRCLGPRLRDGRTGRARRAPDPHRAAYADRRGPGLGEPPAPSSFSPSWCRTTPPCSALRSTPDHPSRPDAHALGALRPDERGPTWRPGSDPESRGDESPGPFEGGGAPAPGPGDGAPSRATASFEGGLHSSARRAAARPEDRATARANSKSPWSPPSERDFERLGEAGVDERAVDEQALDDERQADGGRWH